jgi:hypothetical protein
MRIPGVINLDEPPDFVQVAKTPCKWIDQVRRSDNSLGARTGKGQIRHNVRVVVLVCSKTQGTPTRRWSDTFAMLDALSTAIDAVATSTTVRSLTADPHLAEDTYFGVIAEVEQVDFA